jgi:predicted nucleotidyltransferase
MFEHHQRTINRLVERYQADPGFLAMLLTGSVTRGHAVAGSDVDFALIATDQEHAARAARGALHIYDKEIADYEGGYAEGSIHRLQDLRNWAEHFGEVSRASYVGVRVLWSRVPEVQTLIERIRVYPEAEREIKIEKFLTQTEAWLWYVSEAEKHNSRYLLVQASAKLVLFGCRLILAHNRVLYPYHKWLMRALEDAHDKPPGMAEAAEVLLANPSLKHAEAFANPILTMRPWPNHGKSWPRRMDDDGAWVWQTGHVSLEDW